MSKYKVSNTIHTSALIWGVDIGGYRFETDRRERPFQVYATREIEAATLEEALSIFNEGLFPLLDALSLNRLSAMSAFGTSTMAVREDMKACWIKTLKSRPGTGMSLYTILDTDQEKDIATLAASGNPALHYFRLGLITDHVEGSTVHFLQAVESLAGKTESPMRCRKCKAEPVLCNNCQEIQTRPAGTDHKRLKALLGTDEYKFYYVPAKEGQNSLRNSLFHGELILDGFDLKDHYSALEKAVTSALINKYGLTSLPDIDGVRTLKTYEGFNEFLTYDEPLPEMPTLVRLMHDYQIGVASDPKLGDRDLFQTFKGA